MMSGYNEMADGMGAMMWGMGLTWILLAVVLVLGAAALAKYVFFGGHRG
jgi:tellurite resistance protein TehA-like permease